MNVAPIREGFFHLRGVSLDAGSDQVDWVIMVEFIEPMEVRSFIQFKIFQRF